MTFKDHPLAAFFSPASVAVVGAEEQPDSDGRKVLENLVSSSFGGAVFPVTSECTTVLGMKAHGSIAAVPGQVDLAVIVSPAEAVPAIVAQCADARVKGAIILSAGFRECGPEGARLEREAVAAARRGGLRIVGPNSFGILSTVTGLNASLARSMPQPGSVAFLSQSGALCAAVLDWSFRAMVGFSSFISIGSMADVGWGELIDCLGDDPRTSSIVLYMESVGDARAFLSAAREVALAKPIIVIKSGRTEPAARAAASHTGALTGSDEVLDAAFRRCGVLRVNHLEDLFSMADVLAKQPRPKGPRLTILTNSGGSGVLAADAVIQSGGRLAELSGERLNALNSSLPAHWSRCNPIDLLGDATPERYAGAAEVAARDPDTDGLLIILTPQPATDSTRTAEALKPFARIEGKPVLASWMGGAEVTEGAAILNQAGIPTFSFPDAAARAFQYMWRYSYNLRGIYETPSIADLPDTSDRTSAGQMIAAVRDAGRTLMTELESKKLLAAYGIPVIETHLATSPAEAVELAREIGYPVVLKIHSESITHKARVGGVKLGLANAAAVRKAYLAIEDSVGGLLGTRRFPGVTVQPMGEPGAYEIMIGCTPDPQFGPVLLFGSGGELAETYRDRALALPPLNSTLARRMMEQTRIFRALEGEQGGRPVDSKALEALLVRFSSLVVEQRWIKEIDVNPLLVSEKGITAADARVFLYGLDVAEDSTPVPAIRPYPAHYASTFGLKDGTPVLIRPIKPEDEPLMIRFHETVSDRSVYFRYFHPIRLSRRIAHDRLARMCFIDYSREMALIALGRNPAEIIGVGRLIVQHGTRIAEFAVLVSDQYQNQGLGKELLHRLVEIGRQEKLERIMADILPDNRDMLRVVEKLGFHRDYAAEAGIVRAELIL